MNEKQKKPNQAKQFLQGYMAAKIDRLSYMTGGPDSMEVHAQQVADAEASMREVDSVIQSVENVYQREILRLRYECGWPWRRIINHMSLRGYCESMCYELHGRALQQVSAIIKNRGYDP